MSVRGGGKVNQYGQLDRDKIFINNIWVVWN